MQNRLKKADDHRSTVCFNFIDTTAILLELSVTARIVSCKGGQWYEMRLNCQHSNSLFNSFPSVGQWSNKTSSHIVT